MPRSDKPAHGQSADRVGRSEIQRLPHLTVLHPPHWDDYELIDSGEGKKLERFGPYRLVRPDAQAIWTPLLPSRVWQTADAEFVSGQGEDSAGEWRTQKKLPDQWSLQHEGLRFWVRLTPFRHTGVFPEHSSFWGWMQRQLGLVAQPSVLVLFGYTGLHTLVAARAGASVCHVDASRPATRWARANQELSGLQEHPVRWIVDDAVKFVAREIRRGSRYDMIILDPPVFGRGPKGEIWRLHEALYPLVASCSKLLSAQPVGLLVNAYATNLSAVTLANVLQGTMQGYAGEITAGELTLVETTAGRSLPAALYACWSSMPPGM